MSDICTRTHFQFPVAAPLHIHEWLDALDPIVHGELDLTLEDLRRTHWLSHEHIIVYLHYMYMYRFALPVLEAVCGRDRVLQDPCLARFQLLSCLLGRFLDDLIDRDSGFWNQQQALFWYSRFLIRCEHAKATLSLGSGFDDIWVRSLSATLASDQRLFRLDADLGRIRKPNSCPMPIERYHERVPYFFCLPEALCHTRESLDWGRSYVSALFFLYDIDDSVNDIIRNVATEPAYDILVGSLDAEGRVKVSLADQKRLYPRLRSRAREFLVACRDNGRSLGVELGPAIIDAELAAFGMQR